MSEPVSVAMKRANYTFAFVFAVIILYFLWWGFGYTEHNYPIIFILASIFGIFMAFNIGGNDVANSFGTSVGAGTLTIPQALAVAAIFEVSGAVIAGGEVINTIKKGIADQEILLSFFHKDANGNYSIEDTMQYVYLMMSALLASALWLLFATKKGWPVSTTHSIIGGIVGSALCLGFILEGEGTPSAWDMVKWGKVGEIAISWVLSPMLGGILAWLLFSQIKKYVLDYNDRVEAQIKELKKEKKAHKEQHKVSFDQLSEQEQIHVTSMMARDAQIYSDADLGEEVEYESQYYKGLHELEKRRDSIDTYKALQQWVPLISCIGGMMISAMLLFKGLKNLHMGLTTLHNFLIVGMVGALIWMATFIYAKTLRRKDLAKSTFLMFSWMQVFTAAGFAFSHGANDIANAIGPFAAVLDVIKDGTIMTSSKATMPLPVMITFGVALVAGLWFIGKEVIKTIGTNLTEMHPASGFTAELAAATVVMMASLMGLPVSSTHILVGAVLGIGIVNRNANWNLMKPIGTAWVVTLPSAAILSVIVFLILRAVF